jgi:FdhD protein
MSSNWPREAAVWFEVNGGRRMMTTCTPDDLKAQATGFLRTEDYIDAAADVGGFEIVEGVLDGDTHADCIGVRVRVPEKGAVRVGKLHRHIRENGCGLMHYATCDRSILCAERPLAIPSVEIFRDLFRDVFAAGDTAYPDGGMHTTALCDHERVLFSAHDVGRHNTIDKAVGRALLTGVDLRDCGMLTTARISGAIALKAARSGVSWIASRSVPTSLAVAIAEAAELPIIARAASKEFTIIRGPGA